MPANKQTFSTTSASAVVGEAEKRTAKVDPITDADVPAVADFLHANLNNRVPQSIWAIGMSAPWRVDAPNHGFMLRDGQRIVGAHLAFYSERTIARRTERFCNLAACACCPNSAFTVSGY